MLKEAPHLTLRRNFPRPEPKQVAAFAGLPTGFVVDAMNGSGALHHRIKPVPGTPAAFCGVAVTCHCGPADNLGVFGALAIARRGDVIVAETEAFEGCSVTGDLLLGMAKNRGVIGFVTDGLVRDTPGIVKVGLPTYCAGVSPNSPHKSGPGSAGMTISLGGVTVQAGDIVLGDVDGVVVVPRERIPSVLERIEDVKKMEAAMEAKVQGGLEMPEWLVRLLGSEKVLELE